MRAAFLLLCLASCRTVLSPVVTDRALASNVPKIVTDDCACALTAVVTSATAAQAFLFMCISNFCCGELRLLLAARETDPQGP